MASTVINNSAAQTGVSIDGTVYSNIIWTSLKRSFSVLDTENTGRTVADGRMHRDIIGTYYNYTLGLKSKPGVEASELEYDTVYNLLSAPVASHRIILPYGQGTIAFDAYVTSGEDELIRTKRMTNSRVDAYARWHNLEINFIAMQRAVSPS